MGEFRQQHEEMALEQRMSDNSYVYHRAGGGSKQEMQTCLLQLECSTFDYQWIIMFQHLPLGAGFQVSTTMTTIMMKGSPGATGL
jgi:hypothetical protein